MSDYSDILNKKAKEWNCPDMMDSTKRTVAKIPFSAPMLNYACYGGIPRRRITEFHGAPGGGKSTSAIDICGNAHKIFVAEYEAEVQRLRTLMGQGKKEYAGPLEDLLESGPKKALYVDLEHSFDFKWANKIGVTEDDLDVMQPPDVPAEEVLQTVEDIAKTDQVGLIVLDSIPSLVPRAVLEKKYGERTVSALAGLLTTFMQKIVPILDAHDCTLLLINQIRDNMDNPYVVNTPGGQAVKFYCSLRLLFRLGTPVDFVGNELPASAENPAGYIINVKLIKHKSGGFDRKLASYFLMNQSGIRPDYDYAKLAINKYGIIKKAGAWFTFTDPTTGEILVDGDNKPVKVNGQIKVYDYLQSHNEYYEKLRKYIQDDINGVTDSEEDVSEEEANIVD